ncbi:LTA synthase family protein [Levilactobacillus brevis]|uniref:LTA synthase family protein n=1 Tax=Levilactobacillus brevis TaxID=1580 RepID=UPI0025A1A0FB|nr:LTA synthase family protein [Levilactobacillus brevis]MDM7552458.1 LTA synthase family protein [Levilactobacillus brevis]MDM7649205.1 LTA synthase family protein [Levilactobacillus brevis]
MSVVIALGYLLLIGSGNSSFGQMLYYIFVEGSRVQLLSIVILIVFFLLLLAASNSYWLAVSSFSSIIVLIAIVNYEKFHLRNEGILPSDFLMLNSINKILGMVSIWIVVGGVLGISLLFIIGYFGLRNLESNWHWLTRVIVAISALFVLYGFSNIQKENSTFYGVGQLLGDNPRYYDPSIAVSVNGPLVNFVNNINVKVMKKPTGYSKKRMLEITHKYQKLSEKINARRNPVKQKVVFILSESFSDPSKVPGVTLSQQAIPYTKSLIKNGVGGNMISNGYGGGTANMEYQALTGLSLGNFMATLPTPYTQLVVHQKETYSFNNLFSRSLALHPYDGSLYLRSDVFKKMQFNEFNYMNHGYPQKYSTKIDRSPYVSDLATYKYLIHSLKYNKNSDFVQLSTMQNHLPYVKEHYKDNPIKATGDFSQSEREQIEAYATGIRHTDKANKYLISKLSKMKQNVTIVFYGDHLPGIYQHVDLNKNGVLMHKTPYFIWSNRLKLKKVSYQKMVGPYAFANEVLQATGAKVTPYYAFLQKVSEDMPILASKVANASYDPNLPSGGLNLINRKTEKLMNVKQLSTRQKELLHEYQLIQYDSTVGNHYAFGQLTKKKANMSLVN